VKFLRRVGKAILWPASRFFDPRFRGIATQVETAHHGIERQARVYHDDLVRHLDEVNRRLDAAAAFGERVELALGELRALLNAEIETTTEATAVLGRSLADLLGETDRVRDLIESHVLAFSDPHVDRVVGSRLEDLDEGLAKVLNFAESHRGFAAQRNLWFNPPLSLEYGGGRVDVSRINERIAEVPYVTRALAPLQPGATVLDVGAAESTLAFSLATLGYRVTAIDLHPYPLEHPNLRAVQAPLQDWKTTEVFDAVICLSTIEHIGLGAYGEDDAEENGADLEAMRRIRELTAAGSLLVLTAPFGRKGRTDIQRTYDRRSLERLLEGWNVEDLTVLRKQDEKTWVSADSSSKNGERVAMVTARRP
jgi:Caenorhabditis protein of unknown function, DUF268